MCDNNVTNVTQPLFKPLMCPLNTPDLNVCNGSKSWCIETKLPTSTPPYRWSLINS